MQMKDITEEDGKNIIQLHRLLSRVLQEMKFSVQDATIVDQSIKWFSKFSVMAGEIQKFEAEKKGSSEKKVGEKAEGLSGLDIKDFNPGDLTVVSGGKKTKSKATKKAKAKSGRKRK